MELVKKIAKWLGILILVLLLGLLVVGLIPTSDDDFPSNSNPATDYDEAMGRIDALLQTELPIANETSRSIVLTSGAKTDEVYVLIHGLTNAPHEFAELAEKLHETGNNVIVMRMPYHGLKGLHIKELDALQAEDLREYADEVIDIANGLGETINVIGISGGGAVGAWITQKRPDVSTAVLISPFVGIKQTPMFLDPLVKNALTHLPNISIGREPTEVRYWNYNGQSGNGVAVFMALGQSIVDQAAENPPSVEDVLVLTSASDALVDNRWAVRLADEWRENGADVQTHEFEKALEIPHASVDPVHG